MTSFYFVQHFYWQHLLFLSIKLPWNVKDKRQEKLTKGASRAQFQARAVPESLKVAGYSVVTTRQVFWFREQALNDILFLSNTLA